MICQLYGRGSRKIHGDLLVNRATVLASAGDMVRANQDFEAGNNAFLAGHPWKSRFSSGN